MSIKNVAAKLAVPGMVATLGGYQAYKDYRDAAPSDRRNVLIRDTILLASTGAGAYAGFKGAKKVLPVSTESLSKLRRFLCDYVENLSVPVGGIIGGFISGQIMEKFLPSTNSKAEKELQHKVNILKQLDYGTFGKAYWYAGIGLGEAVDGTFSTLSGFTVGKEQGLKNKIKRATYEIIAGVVIPVAITVPFGRWISKINPTMNPVLKTAALMPIILSACYIGQTVANWFNSKVTAKIIDEKLWEEIKKRQQTLIKLSFENIHNTDVLAKQKIFNQLNELRVLTDEVKTSRPKKQE